MKVLACIFLFSLLILSQAAWTQNHQISGEASKQLSDAIKAKILSNLNKFANQQAANALKNDLNTDDDSKRTLLKLDDLSANQLFSIFLLKDPNCDKNNDGVVSGDQLGCLSKIRKNFVPANPTS